MPQPAQLVHITAAAGKTYSVVGDKYTVLASGDQTGGAYSLTEAIVPPGGGPPPHYHTREEESFYVLEGEITFTVEDRPIVGAAGTFVQIPRRVPHAFTNSGSVTARMLILLSPAGFEQYFAECGTELSSREAAAIPPSPEEIEKLLSVAPKYGIVMLPPK